jgi:PqqA peptide cyclase
VKRLWHKRRDDMPYCSNPIALDRRADEIDTGAWTRVFAEAADLGVLQVHLSGGELAARRDIVEITAAAHRASLYTNLITSAVGLTEKKLAVLAEARLDHVQIPIQDADAASADRMADREGGYARKRGSCE